MKTTETPHFGLQDHPNLWITRGIHRFENSSEQKAVGGDACSMTNWWEEFLEPDGLLLRDRMLRKVDPDKLLVALRSGRLRRVQRSIYIPRDVEYEPLAAARAAVLSSGVLDAVASHRTAGRVHELQLPRGRRCEDVTVARDQRRRNRRDLHFHTRDLTIGDVEVRNGVALTALPRTLADLSCSLDRLAAVWALDDALRRKLCRREAIERAIRRWPAGRPAALAMKRLGESDGVAESILETAGRLALGDAGLPLPFPQFDVFTPNGRFVARLDGAYPGPRVGIEFDGKETHERPEAVLRDRGRQNDLLALGWTVLRFTWWDVTRDTQRFVAMVRDVAIAS